MSTAATRPEGRPHYGVDAPYVPSILGAVGVLGVVVGIVVPLLAAARRVPTGRAHGVDLWRTSDQSGNAEEVTRRNAEAVGGSGRVDLHTADMRKLPFPDAGLDVVVSSLAIHNLKSSADRDTVLDEARRALRPGGRLAVADIRHVNRYAEHLKAIGLTDVEVHGLGPNAWFAGPWQATSVVTARKP